MTTTRPIFDREFIEFSDYFGKHAVTGKCVDL